MKLSQSEIAGLYSQGSAQGATPLGLVVALYDTILRDLRRAKEAIAQKNIEKRTFEMNHALRVIAELENVLDFERGGQAAKQLKNFYGVTRQMILDAGVRNNQAAVDQLLEMFGAMRQAWHDAEKKMNAPSVPPETAMQAPSATPAAPIRSAFQAVDGAEAPRGSWRV